MSRHRTAIALALTLTALTLTALALPAVSAAAPADPPPPIAMDPPSLGPGAPLLADPVLTVTPDDDLIEDQTWPSTAPASSHVTITRSSDGETVAIDCAVDPNCTLTVGGDGVDVLMHNGMDDRGAWIDTPLSFLADAAPAPPAAPVAANPAFTG